MPLRISLVKCVSFIITIQFTIYGNGLVSHFYKLLLTIYVSVFGNMLTTLDILLNIITQNMFDTIEDSITSRCGVDQIDYWLQSVIGMAGSLVCSEYVTFDIENLENLIQLACHLKLDLPSMFEYYEDEQKKTYIVEWLRKETGIPIMLNFNINLEEEDPYNAMWYHLLRYLWAAEMYKYSTSKKSSKSSNNTVR